MFGQDMTEDKKRFRGTGVTSAVPLQMEAPKAVQGAMVGGLIFTLYKDAQRGWRWRLQAANKRIIADSGESYVNKTDCREAIKLIQFESEFAKVK